MKRKILIVLLVLSLLSIPFVAAADLGYVTDKANLLTPEQIQSLEQISQDAAAKYGVDVYVITVEDYSDYGSGDVFEVSYQLYHQYNLGNGADRNGILLLLSMEYRDYALFVYGPDAEYAFSDYALQKLEEEFLDDLGWDDWYGGLYDYADTCRDYLGKAAAGEPVQQNPMKYVPVVILISVVIAFIVCSILKAQMKSVFKKVEADSYTDEAGLNLSGSRDQYTHTTTSRTKISSSNSSSRSGGGGSGRSGKF